MQIVQFSRKMANFTWATTNNELGLVHWSWKDRRLCVARPGNSGAGET